MLYVHLLSTSLTYKLHRIVQIGAWSAMSDQNWDELAILTARIDKLAGERTAARYVGNAHSREQCNAEIRILVERRRRLIDRLSGCDVAPSSLNSSALHLST
jgi:hypothetical protein